MRGLPLTVLVSWLVAIAGLAGCGGDSPTSSAATTRSNPEPHVTTKAPPETGAGLPADAAPETGADIVSVPGGGNVVSNGSGFSMYRTPSDAEPGGDGPTVTAYTASGRELASLPVGSFTAECGIADVRVDDTLRLIITALVSTTPAEGINPEQTSTELTAWNATTGEEVWTIPVSAAGCEQDLGNMVGFAATFDGRWGVYGGFEYAFQRTTVINMRTGDAHLTTRHLQVLGNYLVQRGSGGSPVNRVIDPATLKVASRLRAIAFDTNANAAPTGLFESDTAGSSAPAGLTSDGERLVALVQQEDVGFAAYVLPDTSSSWESDRSLDPYIVGDAGGILFVLDDRRGPAKLVGLDDETGKEKWRVPAGELCGMTGSQFLLGVHGQLAVIDTQTGEQVSYTADESTCPDLLAGGISVTRDSDGTTVTQALEP